MTERGPRIPSLGKRKLYFGLLGLLSVVLGLGSSEGWFRSRAQGAHRAPPPPDLFESPRGCARVHGLQDFARELEQKARLRADRYPYDPQDGIRSIRDYRIARDCYESAGAADEAASAEVAAVTLQARVQTDYASARVNLGRALQSRHWSAVLAEARWLHRLTHHLGEHDYVEWLERIMGRASVRRTAEP